MRFRDFLFQTGSCSLPLAQDLGALTVSRCRCVVQQQWYGRLELKWAGCERVREHSWCRLSFHAICCSCQDCPLPGLACVPYLPGRWPFFPGRCRRQCLQCWVAKALNSRLLEHIAARESTVNSKKSPGCALVILFVLIFSSNQHKESDNGKNAANGGRVGSEGTGMRGGETLIALPPQTCAYCLVVYTAMFIHSTIGLSAELTLFGCHRFSATLSSHRGHTAKGSSGPARGGQAGKLRALQDIRCVIT